jgi:acetate kinase
VRVLVVNAGSATVKLRLLGDDDSLLFDRELAAPEVRIDPAALQAALDEGLAQADAVGHRIVHGGERFRDAVRIDSEVEQAIDALADLAPLHQPKALAALRSVSEALPDVPAVACFDTAFHATIPPPARTYALPATWSERWHLRRYGFHGLSHAWVTRRVPDLLGVAASELRIVSCHLGAGASLCAIDRGSSIDTTMGFTPLEGLVMATRSGDVDPGLLLWLLERHDVSPPELADTLERGSGLLGLAGTADMREVIDRALNGEPTATLTLDVYLHRLRAAIAGMAASLQGVDVLVFTGGIGERAAVVRARAAAGIGFLGIRLDEQLNAEVSGEGVISPLDCQVRTVVVHAREDLEISHQVRRVLR